LDSYHFFIKFKTTYGRPTLRLPALATAHAVAHASGALVAGEGGEFVFGCDASFMQ
jgi:hypothetical protein